MDNERQPDEELIAEAEKLLESGDIVQAQNRLDEIEQRSGKVYFVQSKIYAQKNWRKEQRRQLEYAINAEPENVEYREALEKLAEIEDKIKTDEELLSEAEELINKGDLCGARTALNAVKEQSGRKYFIESKFYKNKGWYNEQRKCLKKALKAEPENEEYKKSMEELERFRKTAEYKRMRKQMGVRNGFTDVCGEGCAECFCEGCMYGLCTCICEGIGNGC